MIEEVTGGGTDNVKKQNGTVVFILSAYELDL